MNRLTLTLREYALLTALLIEALCPQGLAADFQAAMEAYEQGDFVTVLQELRPLAEQGDAEAQFFLGGMYDEGTSVPQNDAEALKWYRKAAEQGHAWAQHNLGH